MCQILWHLLSRMNISNLYDICDISCPMGASLSVLVGVSFFFLTCVCLCLCVTFTHHTNKPTQSQHHPYKQRRWQLQRSDTKDALSEKHGGGKVRETRRIRRRLSLLPRAFWNPGGSLHKSPGPEAIRPLHPQPDTSQRGSVEFTTRHSPAP